MESVTISLTREQAEEVSTLLDMRTYEAMRMSEDAAMCKDETSASYWSAVAALAADARAAVKQGLR